MRIEWTMILPLAAGYAADLLVGDPSGWPHPVRAFGYAIRNGTRRLNKGSGRFVKGMLLTLALCGLACSIPWYILRLLAHVWLPGYYTIATVAVFFCLAGKNLLDEGQAVFDTLDREGLEAGRRQLTRIVGRETANLTEQQVRIAVLESMSENLSDGVIAPLVFYLIGGVPAMLLYKMINTLDSMIGYKREPYRLFGRFAARLDDVANFLPARLTAWLMVLVTASPRGARFIFRYGHAHTSPNAGYPEAALAGILNCRFGGPNVYHGITVIKPWLGDNDRPITPRDFSRVRYINHTVTVICLLLVLSGFAHWDFPGKLPTAMDTPARFFTPEDVALLQEIILHRRDVRGNRFVDCPVEQSAIDQLLRAALHAPSVGFSQPWEFVLIRDRSTRQRIKDSFDEANVAAQPAFGDRQDQYARLKLEGILEAALNMAVFYKPPPGPVLGQTAMAETGLYSVVCAIQNMWLMARALNLGLGWVSILDAEKVAGILNAPPDRKLVAYLCIGYTDGFFDRPELEMLEWEKRRELESVVHNESY